MKKTDSYYKLCVECGEDFDTDVKKCSCGSDEELVLVDTRETCGLCGKKEEEGETYECERKTCGKKVCLECCTNGYPFSTTICNECHSDFEMMMSSNYFPGF